MTGACSTRLAAALLCAALLGCAPREREPAPAVWREPVRVTRARAETLAPLVESYGTIVHRSKADVHPTTEGNLEAVLADEGTRVVRGQVLATLDRTRLRLAREGAESELRSREALLELAEEKLAEGRRAVEVRQVSADKTRAEIAQRRAELENLSLVYANKQRLFEAGGVAESELEAVRVQHASARTRLVQAEHDLRIQRVGLRDEDLRRAGLEVPAEEEARHEALVQFNTRMLLAEREVARAQLEAARSELRRIDLLLEEAVIRSPIGGTVGARLLDVGEKAGPDTRLFTILYTGEVYAQVEIGESDLGAVRIGQPAEVLPEDEGGELRGAVALITPYIDPQTRTARVRILLDNRSGRLVPGQFVRARIATGRPVEQVTVPHSALLEEDGGGPCLFVVRGGRLFRTPVTPGRREGERVGVLRGLSEGDRVVVRPSASFRDGLPVEVIDE